MYLVFLDKQNNAAVEIFQFWNNTSKGNIIFLNPTTSTC